MHRRLRRGGRLFRQIDERYEGGWYLPAFYVRNRNRSGPYEAAAREAIARFFPNELEEVKLADFSTAPQDGVVLAGMSVTARKLGLRIGDVFVAIDGYRIRNFLKINGNMPQRSLGAAIAD